jgi:hypothetical protein
MKKLVSNYTFNTAARQITLSDYTSVDLESLLLITNVTDNIIPEVVANVTITNEGLNGTEYQYEWCIVSIENNPYHLE